MLFRKLKLNYFGRFQNREIELKPGINLIYGDNEAGKSTIHSFIKGMLFGIERMRGRGSASKEDLYTRYLPWDYPGAYGGSLELCIKDKEYRLLRSFHANDKSFTITELSTGREVKLKEGLISELLPGLTESAFRNTISIEQLKAQTDSELAAQVRNYIANLSIAKSKEVDVAKAVSLLNEQRKQLEPTQNTAALKALQAEIEEGLYKEEKMDRLTLRLKELLVKEQELKERKEAAEKFIDSEEAARMGQLPAIQLNFKSYQEEVKQLELQEHQEKQLLADMNSGERPFIPEADMKEDIREAEQLRIKQTEFDGQVLELQRQKDSCSKSLKRNLILCILTVVPTALAVPVLTGFTLSGGMIAAALIMAGTAICIILNINNRKQSANLIDKETKISSRKSALRERTDNILKKYRITKLEELAGKQQEILKSYYTLENLKQRLEASKQRKKEHEETQDNLYETIMKYMQSFIREEELTEASMQRLQAAVRQRKLEYKDRLTEAADRYDDCKNEIVRLKWEIGQLEGNEEELIKNQERYNTLEQVQKENAAELEAIRLALSTIQELSADIHDSFGQQLNKAVSDIISEVTGGRYNDLKIDEKLEVKVGWNGNYVPLDRLSAGTIDQVYFALRLATADLLLGPDEVPLLLDDSFALYDEARVKAALEGISKRKQIILFTCHKREQTILKELGLPYNMVDLSCS